jgi:hypothetical protein
MSEHHDAPLVPRIPGTLRLDRASAVLLLQALSHYEEQCDTRGCIRDGQLARLLLLKVRAIVREVSH